MVDLLICCHYFSSPWTPMNCIFFGFMSIYGLSSNFCVFDSFAPTIFLLNSVLQLKPKKHAYGFLPYLRDLSLLWFPGICLDLLEFTWICSFAYFSSPWTPMNCIFMGFWSIYVIFNNFCGFDLFAPTIFYWTQNCNWCQKNTSVSPGI